MAHLRPTLERVPGSTMDRNTWDSLGKASKNAWDMITPSDEAAILNYANKRGERSARQVNVHDMTEEVETTEDVTQVEESEELEEQDNDPEDTMEANVARGGKAHPGDARRMMGTTNPRKSNLKSNRKYSGNVARLEFNTARVNKKKNGRQGSVNQWGSDLINAPLKHTSHNPSMIGPDEMESWGIDSSHRPLMKR